MTPPVPTGSSPRSTETASDRTRADGGAPPASDRPTVAPLRLSIESSYLLAGQSGFALRGGLLVTYRPDRLIGLGIHLDTNFTDHFSATARGEAIWPIHRYFQFQGAIELGARAFMNQRLTSQGEDHQVNGALFTFGGEIAASIPFTDVIGASLFLRAFYSPGGGLSTAGGNDGPAIGIQAEGGEILLGLRLDFYPPVAPHHRDPADEAPRSTRTAAEEAPAPSQREALQDLEHSVEALLERPSSGSSPAGGGDAGAEPAVSSDAATADSETSTMAALSSSDREEILALQREIRSLTESAAALETELDAATQILNDLSAGQETVGPFHIRLDSFYDNLTARPPSLDLPALTAFLQEFRDLIRDNGSVRLLAQSPTETFGEVIVRNFTSVRDALTTYQRSLPARARAGHTARAELEPALAQLGVIIAELEQLHRNPESTQPPAHQVQLWRIRMDRIRGHIEEVGPRLDETAAQSLRSNFQRLEGAFTTLTQQMDEAQRGWLVTRALYSHYRDFRSARRPEQAMTALRGIQTELNGAPESYRRLRSRNLATLTHALAPFVRRYSLHPAAAWTPARALAIEILTWIDPAYQAPAVAEPTRRRGSARRGSTEPIFEFPTAGGGTGD